MIAMGELAVEIQCWGNQLEMNGEKQLFHSGGSGR